MKGFGHVGQGGPYPASSNLSPLAPPFALDPSHPRPRTNSIDHLTEPHFTETPTFGYTLGPQRENWLQLHNPTSAPSSFPGTNQHDLSSGYDHFNSSYLGSQSVGNSYLSGLAQYPSNAIHGSSTSVSISEQGSMVSKCGVASFTPASSLWNGNNSGDPWRRQNMNVTGRLPYNSFQEQGLTAADELTPCENLSGVWLGKHVESFARESHSGTNGTDLMNCKSSSASDDSAEVIPFNLSRASETKYHPLPSMDFFQETWDQNNQGTDSCRPHLTDSYTTCPVSFYPSTAYKTFPPIYDSRVTINNSKAFTKAQLSSNLNPIERPKDVCDTKEDNQVFADGREGHRDTSKISNGVGVYNQGSLDSSLNETDASSKQNPIAADSLDSFFKVINKMNHNFNLAPTAGDDSINSSSEMPDQFNSVDSPCWRGASGSSHGLFRVTEAPTPQPLHQQVLPVNSEPGMVSPSKLNNLVYHEMGFESDGSSSFAKQTSSVVGLQSTEHDMKDVKAGSDYSNTSKNDVIDGSSIDVITMKNNYDGTDTLRQIESNNRVLGLERDIRDAACVGFSHTLDHGIAHVLTRPLPVGFSHTLDRGLEHVSTRPLPGGSGLTNVADPFSGVSDALAKNQISGIDVQLLVKAMHNLSEVLLSCCSKGVDALQEHDHEVIQNIVKNLDACSSKNTRSRSSTPHLYKGSEGGGSHAVNTKINNLLGKKVFLEKRNSDLNTRKEDKIPLFSLISADEDFKQEDHMTQALKRILEENFHDEEESLPQISLYKNLWLETEAALCSMKYKARLADMKIKMEKHKQHQPKVPGTSNSTDAEILENGKVALELNGDNVVASEPKKSSNPNSSTKSTGSISLDEEVDANVMARFHILNNFNSSATQSSIVSPGEEVDANVMARFHILNNSATSTTQSSIVNPREEVDANVMARIHILNNSARSSTQSSIICPGEEVDPNIIARFHILNSRVENSVSLNKEKKRQDSMTGGIDSSGGTVCSRAIKNPLLSTFVDIGFANRSALWPFIKAQPEDKCLGVDNITDVEDSALNSTDVEADSDDRVSQQSSFLKEFDGSNSHNVLIQSVIADTPADELHAGGSSSSSSDWEHILKETAYQT